MAHPLSHQYLYDLSFKQRNPELSSTAKELELGSRNAFHQLSDGKISQKEYDDIVAHTFEQTIDALPMEEYAAMRKDGRFEYLEALTSHDGTRPGWDVANDRKKALNKIKADALDEAWMDGRIDDKYYAQNMQEVAPRDELEGKITDGKYEDVAVDHFLERNDFYGTKEAHKNSMTAYFKSKYGEDHERPIRAVSETEKSTRVLPPAAEPAESETVSHDDRYAGVTSPDGE